MESHYYHHDNHLKRQKYVKRFRWFGWGIFIAILLIVIFVILYLVFFVKPEEPGVTSTATTTAFSKPISVFKTPYYQFQAGEHWESVATDEEGHFYYRNRLPDKSISLHDLDIRINPTKQQIDRAAASRVQAITIDDNLFQPVNGISEPCQSLSEDLVDNDTVTLDEVTFKCTTGSAIFDVIVARKSGGVVIETVTGEGNPISILMYYRDLRSVPDGKELAEIVRTFQIL